MITKDARIAVRVDQALKDRLDAITAATGVDEATIVRNCLEALCNHVERTGQISFPIAVSSAPRLNAGETRYPPPVSRHSAMNETKKKK